MLSKISIRLKLSDFINTEHENVIMDMINQAHIELNASVILYLWFDDDVEGLRDFLLKWEPKLAFKTIVKNNGKVSFDEFIFYDIVPLDTPSNSSYRFRYSYKEPEQIIDGLKEFYNITKFITSDKPIKKQKRNDYED
tara:strand:- start:304 stop:717 length:414 start_codon:yes stop_codon:yes gene_type:complete